MIVVHHRVNDPARLMSIPQTEGLEIDVRTHMGRLVLAHDPFQDGPAFDELLDAFRHSLLIVNVKEEGLEPYVLPLLRERGIEDFFLLDQGTPFLVRTVRAGEGRVAVRVSEYEGLEGARRLAGLARWLWLDPFLGWPAPEEALRLLREDGTRICLVSPELHAPERAAEIGGFQRVVARCPIDAVCTRQPERWRGLSSLPTSACIG